MKKNSKTMVVAMIVVATVAILMIGCKKEQTFDVVETKQGEATLVRIMDFKQQLETVKVNPNAKSSVYMSVSDAIWNLEALFNFTYAYPDDYYVQTVTYDTTLYMPVCTNDSVSLADLSVFYGEMFSAVQTLYQATSLSNMQFLILDVEAGERNGNQQSIALHTVQGSAAATPPPTPDPPQPWRGPFTNGLTWFYGENGGNLQGLNPMNIDAADTLTSTLNARLVPKAPQNYEYVYTQILHKESALPEDHPFSHNWFPNVSSTYCEFYRYNPSENNQWLDPDLMNFHYYGECKLVMEDFRNEIPIIPSTHSLFFVIVEDYKIVSINSTVIGHHTEACYGIRELIGQNVVNREDL